MSSASYKSSRDKRLLLKITASMPNTTKAARLVFAKTCNGMEILSDALVAIDEDSEGKPPDFGEVYAISAIEGGCYTENGTHNGATNFLHFNYGPRYTWEFRPADLSRIETALEERRNQRIREWRKYNELRVDNLRHQGSHYANNRFVIPTIFQKSAAVNTMLQVYERSEKK